MKSNAWQPALLGLALMLATYGVQLQASGICFPVQPQEGLGVVYNDERQPDWNAWEWGVTADEDAITAGKNGSYALKVTYEQPWREFILYRSDSLLWNIRPYKALVFRIKGIKDRCQRQVMVQIRSTEPGVVFKTIPVTDYMVNPPDTEQNGNCWGNTVDTLPVYDPTKWYTVAIPLEAFFIMSFAPEYDEVLPIKELVFEGAYLDDNGLNGTIYLDDIWWVEGLEFPLAGYEADTAPISSVFDHSMADANGYVAPYKKDYVVTAYTGEVADEGGHTADSTCIARDVPLSTAIGNYDGAGVCDLEAYLSYDGHPGIDYAVADVNVYPVADGTVVTGKCIDFDASGACTEWEGCLIFNAGGTCAEWGAVGIDHGNGYISQYWHMEDIQVARGNQVTTNTILGTASDVGTPGAKHLHFEVALKTGDGYVHVDPYGWTDVSSDDPHRVKAVSVPLWK